MNRLAPSTARAGGRQLFATSHFRALHRLASVTEAEASTSPHPHPHVPLRSPIAQHASVGPLRTTSSPRRTAQDRLARIEATRGVVSPFLIDSFGREHDYLRISLTEKCNLRCTYCMPEEGAPLSPKENLLSTEEIVRIASLFVANGVRKIRLTGGEPTIRKDLLDIVSRLSALGLDSLGMTSNGIALSRKLPDLVKAGLTGLNVSLDTLDPHKFELMTRRRGHAAVLKAIQQAANLLQQQSDGPSLKTLKLNVVVINKLNSDEITQFVELSKDMPIDVRFIEYMPFDGNRWSDKKLVPSMELLSRIASSYPSTAVEAITPGISDTARIYRVQGYKGTFGFISSMTDHFCSGCSRLRIGADGSMKTCLFGEPKLSIRDLLRNGASNEELAQAVGAVVKKKHFAHDGKAGGNASAATLSRERSENAQAAASSAMLRAPFQHHTAQGQRRNSGRCTVPLQLLSGPGLSQTIRLSSTLTNERPRLSHISSKDGKPTMVSITNKSSTSRSATATGRVRIPKIAYDLLTGSADRASGTKGNVLAVAQLAGIMAAKKTSDLIPLCHPISLANVDVRLDLGEREMSYFITVQATADVNGATGVEMEALTAVNVACLTIWDMLKAVAGKEMVIEDVKVVAKSGGKSGDWTRRE